MADYILNGSICITDIIEQLQKKPAPHSAFSRSQKNNKVYLNLSIFVSKEPDQYKNNASAVLNSTKDKKEEEKKANNGKDIYVGNFKLIELGVGEPLAATAPEAQVDLGDLPF